MVVWIGFVAKRLTNCYRQLRRTRRGGQITEGHAFFYSRLTFLFHSWSDKKIISFRFLFIFACCYLHSVNSFRLRIIVTAAYLDKKGVRGKFFFIFYFSQKSSAFKFKTKHATWSDIAWISRRNQIYDWITSRF